MRALARWGMLFAILVCAVGALGASLPVTKSITVGTWTHLTVDISGVTGLNDVLIVFDGAVTSVKAVAYGKTGGVAAVASAAILPETLEDYHGYAWALTFGKAIGGPGSYLEVSYSSTTLGVVDIKTGKLAVYFAKNDVDGANRAVFFFTAAQKVAFDALGEIVEDVIGYQPGIGFRVATVDLTEGEVLMVVYDPTKGEVSRVFFRKV